MTTDLLSLYRIFQSCSSVTTDSRHCPENALFIALKGESFNGNAFAVQALGDGCAYAVIDEPCYAVEGDSRFIKVENALEALQQLAGYHRRQLKTKVIGITGTNGKTTTKELIAAVLSQSYKVLYTSGNLNNYIGVPLTLLQLNAGHQLAVIEMGANHPGEIKTLAHIVDPDYGIITNVGKAHLEGFGSFEGVIRTKKELYDYLCEKENTAVFIHYDNPYLMNMALGLKQIAYGTGDDLYINGNTTDSSLYLSFEWKEGREGMLHPVQTQLIGDYNLPNALAAITIGRFFEIESEAINKSLEAYAPQNNRSQLNKTANNTLVIDAYNANPTSMAAALGNFRNISAVHKTLIVGDMKELGGESATEHQKIINYIDTCDFEKVFLVGKQFAATKHAYVSYLNVHELIAAFQKEPLRGKTILIKGSNGMKLNQIVEFL
ncbi:UDP-N-acetylmuramoyl-tripeptide--D-alanyl-D-alanine ligase [termite gut metagenome]|uniref:UDP-MurNAc-pentapeptide synthetase n=1 Tax=termite gut metagenome TaxID=433724 RepID=A0A5J4R167_9ZZZZ